jgi:hypothetical protein
MAEHGVEVNIGARHRARFLTVSRGRTACGQRPVRRWPEVNSVVL